MGQWLLQSATSSVWILMLPPRDLSEPIPTGPLAGWKMDENKYNTMLDDYHDLHGWDRETSFPKRETLANLGLEYVADDLDKIGKLK
jgi:aldehyde:ferredoxin oxidoreductase